MATILIADDEPHILTLTRAIFESVDMTVVTANNGEEAIEKVETLKPDIVITDLIMPKKNGFDVCRHIRNSPDLSEIPIIILSALGDEYNKITGFEGGADDYVTKPFSVEELKARVRVLLHRSQPSAPKGELSVETVATGLGGLDEVLKGGLPKGSNILVIGKTGQGKSSFARRFVAEGLKNSEKGLFVAIDDDPKRVREQIELPLNQPISYYEKLATFRIVDAYSWSSFQAIENEAFAVQGMLELNQLAGVISDAGFDLGQTVQQKMGGRRVLDSISSLLVNFDLASAQRFLSQIARTALAFGGITTLFILEEGSISDQVLNNTKYIMDGILEFADVDGKQSVRVVSMKWANYSKQWIPIQ